MLAGGYDGPDNHSLGYARMSDAILQRWMMLKQDEGVSRARRVSLWLSVAALSLCIAVAYGLFSGRFPPWLLVAMSLPIGWLIAERNALDSRSQQWPTFSRYIDWSRVEADLVSDQK